MEEFKEREAKMAANLRRLKFLEEERKDILAALGLLGGGTGLTVAQEVEHLVKFAKNLKEKLGDLV